jgi:O-antigen/teichoic acid export membrane protein
MGVVTVLSVIISLRLDVAVFNINTQKQLESLINAGIICSFLISGAIYGALLILDYTAPSFVKEFNLNSMRGEALSLGVVWALNMFIQNVYIYGAHFKRQAAVRIFQAALIATGQLTAALMGWGVKGIIHTQIITSIIILFYSFFDVFRLFHIPFSRDWLSGWRQALMMHWRFPVFSMPADFISSFASQLPMLMMGKRFGLPAAGQYALTNKVLTAPMKLLAGSILSVFKEEAARSYREKGECREIFAKTLMALALLAITPFALLFCFAEPLFVWIFGDEWREAGNYASILAPMFYVQFIASPLSYVIYLANRQILDLAWQLCLLIATYCVFYYTKEIIMTMKLYSFGYSLLYIIYLAMAYKAAKSNSGIMEKIT